MLKEELTVAAVSSAIRACWSADTAWHPSSWDPARPAAGQCWASAYVLRALMGGEIAVALLLPSATPRQRHAWNVLPDGTVVDLTREQFSPGQQFEPCIVDEALVHEVAGPQAARLLDRVCAYLAVARPGLAC